MPARMLGDRRRSQQEGGGGDRNSDGHKLPVDFPFQTLFIPQSLRLLIALQQQPLTMLQELSAQDLSRGGSMQPCSRTPHGGRCKRSRTASAPSMAQGKQEAPRGRERGGGEESAGSRSCIEGVERGARRKEAG
eukprot:751473-Hanusia_phi.AAC.1